MKRTLHVGVVIAGTFAAVGLFSGVRGTGRDVASYVRDRPPAITAREARSYVDMRTEMTGPNASIQAQWWTFLPRADVFAPVIQSDVDRDSALARRAARRAFAGAPPTIPHAIDQLAIPVCLRCHEHGARIGSMIAPAMSHGVLGSCVQCHVVANDPRPRATTPPAPDNTFAGAPSPSAGERAWVGAPPTIPHATWMRERCESCHGVYGLTGIRTTHPWRSPCTQCHAPAAVLDQRPAIAIGATP